MSAAANGDGGAPAAMGAILGQREEDQPLAAEGGNAIAAGAIAAAGPQFSPLLAGIARLKEEQKALKAEKKRIQKELRNQEKKRARLRSKAKQLTDEDLLQVLNLRAAHTAEVAQKRSSSNAGAAASSSSGARGSNE